MTDKERIEELERLLKETKELHEIERFYLVNQARQFQEAQNQKAVEALARVKELLNNEEFMVFRTPEMVIDNLIKEYGGKQC